MWSDSTLAGNSSRPAILQLRIESDQELYQAYIPSFQGGGLFVPPAGLTSWATSCTGF